MIRLYFTPYSSGPHDFVPMKIFSADTTMAKTMMELSTPVDSLPNSKSLLK
jgi:hypothetical protein